MLRLLPLLLALNASAADKPLALRTLHTFPRGIIDRGFTMIATQPGSSVILWSLDTGRQLAHVDLPAVERRHKNDLDQVKIHDIRPDLKWMLVSHRHLYFNTLQVNGGPTMARSIQSLYLVSTEDEKNIKKLWTIEGPCAFFKHLEPYHCPGLDDTYPSAHFSSDRPEVVVNARLYYDGHLAGSHKDLYQGTRSLVFDLRGKKLFENEYVEERGALVKGIANRYVPASAKPELRIVRDDQSCRVMRDDDRVSFLESCVGEDWPSMSQDGRRARSGGRPIYKAWNAATGKLETRLDPRIPEGWDQHAYWDDRADGRVVSLLLKRAGSEERRIEIWDAVAGKRLAVGVGPEFENIRSFRLSPDGRRALYLKDERMAFVDLGLEDAPPAPAPLAAAKVDVDELPSGVSKLDPEAFAIVIGVEKYRQDGVPAVDYAARDAKTMAAYLGAMGFDAKNVAVLTDAQAGKVDFDKYFGKWLKNRVGPKSRVFVYYAGHGAPNPTTGAGYLMPYEADPSYLDETAYPVTQLYAELAKLPTKDVTVVLDACFSGQGERSLIAKGTRPLVAMQKTRGPENAAVIAAASGSQISASDHEARHGLLTYHLLAGLHGGADDNGDGKITTAEIFKYAGPAVERAAKLQNVEQTPTVSGENGLAGARIWTTLKKP